ncbi:MAG: acyl-CoA dehydrogenase [Deltaproteobacteria bacterium]|nr:acyl-CoA dehydrogenase [Deltaproteobacteria bacterium]
MDFSFSPEEEQFRQELRQWLKTNLPEGWGTPSYKAPKGEGRLAFLRDWQRKMYDGGYVGLSWPKEYGGRGASMIEMAIFNEEMAKVEAPGPLNVLGLSMAGPTIIVHGTEEQKKRHLQKILNCDEIWCQGFSEPGSGSDVASIRTKAELHGDEFIVNGQKVWTTLAHVADWCMLLVRTDPDAPKHRGISYILVDTKSPGITVRPLRQMTGESEFNEIFFEDVRVPRANLVGELNNGWGVALTTLMNERGTASFGTQARFRILYENLVGLAKQSSVNGREATRDPVVRQQLAQHLIDVEILKYSCYRNFTRLLRGGTPGPEGSILKLWWSELNQRMQETAMMLEGPYNQLTRESPWAVEGGRWQHHFMRSRANTIEAGTSEIQRNIIAERVLRMPKGR